MRLDTALVAKGLCESRTEAQELIKRGAVSVNGIVSHKQTKDVGDDDTLAVSGRRDFVSRGGDKLAGAFFSIFKNREKGTGEQFQISHLKFLNKDTDTEEKIRAFLKGKVALDIGSSTGGFTDFLLQHGIKHVDAVDVGTDQLHSKLRADPRVSLFESTDIRNFTTEIRYDVVVADLSFISLESVFDTALDFGKEGTDYFLLLKPQFEVGKGNTKKGIVKDMPLVLSIMKKYEVLAKLKGLRDVQVFPCHIQGGGGNQEYFLVGKK